VWREFALQFVGLRLPHDPEQPPNLAHIAFAGIFTGVRAQLPHPRGITTHLVIICKLSTSTESVALLG
jgi:hypothetical protein